MMNNQNIQDTFLILRQNIKRILKEKEINQEDLALKLGITMSYLNSLLDGRKHFTENTLTVFAKILNTPLIELFTEKNKTLTKIDKKTELEKVLKKIHPEITKEKDFERMTKMILDLEIPILKYGLFVRYETLIREHKELIAEFWEEQENKQK